MTDKYIIRTSDRIQFKKCRRAWDIGSKIRQDLEPKKVRPPLDFGTEIHAGLERWYDPKLYGYGNAEVHKNIALIAFHNSWKTHWKNYERDGVLSEEVKQEMADRQVLGPGMIENYIRWAEHNDKRFTPVLVEIEFEVPIEIGNLRNWPEGVSEHNGQLHFNGTPVFYQGRIDLIFLDNVTGKYWLVDHKTAARLQENTSWLEMDEQMKSYAWAIQKMLKIDVAGVLYNELYKGIPEPPAELKTIRKGLSYSTSKSADTTFELALETFKTKDRAAFKAGLYDDYLTYLKEVGRQFVRRTPIPYTSVMLDNLGDQICLEAIDMLNDPMVYPNPSKFGCDWCDHRLMCLAMYDGQPIEWIKDTMYNKRSEMKEPNGKG